VQAKGDSKSFKSSRGKPIERNDDLKHQTSLNAGSLDNNVTKINPNKPFLEDDYQLIHRYHKHNSFKLGEVV